MRKIAFVLSIMITSFVLSDNPIEVGADEYKTEKITFAVETVTETEIDICVIEKPETPKYLIPVSDEDIELMARVVMSESSILPDDAKQGVAQTIVNRVLDGRWGNTVKEVINYPNAYSTQDNGDPTPECYKAVISALTYVGFPPDMYYFKSGSPHTFGYLYAQYGNTYFTTETDHESKGE